MPLLPITSNDEMLNDFLNGKSFAALCFGMLAIVAACSFSLPVFCAPQGILWRIDAPAVAGVLSPPLMACGLTLVTGLLLIWLNKTYSFIRSVTWLGVSAMSLLTLSAPLSFGFTSAIVGALMCPIVLLAAHNMFGHFRDEKSQGDIYLCFTVIAAAALADWTVIILVPVMLVGYAEMRALRWRGFLAALLGLITPLWIVLGLRLARVDDLCLPGGNPVWKVLTPAQTVAMIVQAVAAAVATLVFTGVNLFTVFNYRLRLRAYNAFFVIASLLTIVAMAVDYVHLPAYLPLLHLCLAIQLAHTFTTRKEQPKRYRIVLWFATVCVVVGVAQLLSSLMPLVVL